MTMISLSMTGACTGGQCSLRRLCRPCQEGSRRTHTLPPSLVEHCWLALKQRGRIPNGSAQPSLRRSGRGGSYGKSRPLSDQEYRSAQELGGENRVTHSTLRGGVVWAGKDPQKSAILGSRQVHNRAGKAAPAAQSVYSQSIEPPYFNRLISRRSPLASEIKGGSSGQA